MNMLGDHAYLLIKKAPHKSMTMLVVVLFIGQNLHLLEKKSTILLGAVSLCFLLCPSKLLRNAWPDVWSCLT